MNIIAIDPGKAGGAVEMNEHGRLGDRLAGGDNAVEMVAFLRGVRDRCGPGNVKAVIEYQHAFPGIAAKANFSVGVGFGFWRGLLTAMDIGYECVNAADWQKIITKRKGWKRADLKKALIGEALQRWPELAEHRKGELSGVADAALLAEFTRTRRAE